MNWRVNELTKIRLNGDKMVDGRGVVDGSQFKDFWKAKLINCLGIQIGLEKYWAEK